MSDDGEEGGELQTIGLTERQALGLSWIKKHLADPFLALTHRELDVREHESSRELEVAEGELRREHVFKMRALHISALLMVLLVLIAGGLLFYDKDTGMIVISLISVGFGTYSFGRSKQLPP